MTNAAFLNKNFGTSYKAWMKCTWEYSTNLKVWMIEFDENIRFGWRNIVIEDRVIENFVLPLERQIPPHRDFTENYRLVVDKAQNYKILGVYKYDKDTSDKRVRRVWIKVANSLEEFLQKKL